MRLPWRWPSTTERGVTVAPTGWLCCGGDCMETTSWHPPLSSPRSQMAPTSPHILLGGPLQAARGASLQPAGATQLPALPPLPPIQSPGVLQENRGAATPTVRGNKWGPDRQTACSPACVAAEPALPATDSPNSGTSWQLQPLTPTGHQTDSIR